MCELGTWTLDLRQIAGVTCGPFPVLAGLHLGEFHSHLCLSKIKSIVHVSETMADSRQRVKTVVLVDPGLAGLQPL